MGSHKTTITVSRHEGSEVAVLAHEVTFMWTDLLFPVQNDGGVELLVGFRAFLVLQRHSYRHWDLIKLIPSCFLSES